MLIDGRQAWQNVLTNRHSRWSQIAERFDDDFMSIVTAPKFKIKADANVFCIGSCFARNIEENLIYRDLNVTSKRIVSPKEEFGNRPAGVVNKYTTASMLNEFDWLETAPRVDDLLVENRGGWLDLHLHADKPVGLARGLERRRYMSADYFSRVKEADVLIVTLGLTEAWFDTKVGVYLNIAPPLSAIEDHPGRFQFDRTDSSANFQNLVKIREAMKRVSPRCRIIISVSPVAMAATFTGEDVIQANMQSKSTLRVAAQQMTDAFDDVDYFPSYELAMMSPRREAFHKDCLHVSEQAVRHIVDLFLETRLGTAERRFPDFTEKAYFKANPDVEASVRRGELTSGYHHWTSIGQFEGRRMSPA